MNYHTHSHFGWIFLAGCAIADWGLFRLVVHCQLD